MYLLFLFVTVPVSVSHSLAQLMISSICFPRSINSLHPAFLFIEDYVCIQTEIPPTNAWGYWRLSLRSIAIHPQIVHVIEFILILSIRWFSKTISWNHVVCIICTYQSWIVSNYNLINQALSVILYSLWTFPYKDV